MAEVYFSLGSNQGDRLKNLQSATEQLQNKIGEIQGQSKVYESEPWGYKDQEQYLNQVIHIQTQKMPIEILEIAMQIESELGRKRSGWQGYESRTMDIDILLYDDLEINTKKLTVPHPKMHLRNFVLIPLVEISPNVVHPFFRQTISDLRVNCNDKAMVTAFQFGK